MKRITFAIEMHSITGLKMPIFMMSLLFHFITNDVVREIETAQVEQIDNFYKESESLPVLLENDNLVVPTIFWWDI